MLLALALALAAGALAGWLTPRGPLSQLAGLLTIVGGLAVGLAGGYLMRSRWALLALPLAFVAALELARLGVEGPTVDGIVFSAYGAIAFVTGRGVIALVALLPMLLGAALGAARARREDGAEPERHGASRLGLYGRRAFAVLGGLLVVLLAVGIARPADTDPITGPDGEPLPGSVAELTEVEIGGNELDLMIRGTDRDSPVLLYLAGGPGGTELGAMRNHLEGLEERFVVVTWDQRGSGKSYDELSPAGTLTFASAIEDTIELTEHLRERFGEERIYLIGQSYGSLLGIAAADLRPELYEAFIGTGQMVSPRATDRIFYADTLEWARENGEEGLVEHLEEIGPPPYDSILDYEAVAAREPDVYPFDRTGNSEGRGGFSENLFVEEYTLLEQIHNLAAFIDTYSALYPHLQDVDLRESTTELDVPVFLIQGEHEARGRAEPARQWFRRLEAPTKELIVIEGAGHRPLFQEPERFLEAIDEVLARTGSRGP